MPDLRVALSTHARAIDDRFEPLDPAELRARAEREVRSSEPSPVVGLDDVEKAGLRGSAQPPRPKRWLVAAAALVVLVVVAVTVARARDGSVTMVDPSASSLPSSPVPMSTTTSSATPSPDPSADPSMPPAEAPSWRELPAFTLDEHARDMDVLDTIWTGTDVLLLGERTSDAALWKIPAFDLASDTWRQMPETPQPMQSPVTAWTGTHLIAVGTLASNPAGTNVGAVLDPATGQWTPMATAPQDVSFIAGAWTGDRLVAWALPGGVHAYDPAGDRWEQLTAEQPGGVTLPDLISLNPKLDLDAAWTGRELLVIGRSHRFDVAFDPTARRWRALAGRPAGSSETMVLDGSVAVAGDGREIATLDTDDPDATWQARSGFDSWRARDRAALLAIDGHVVSWGGTDFNDAPVSSPGDPATAVIRLDLGSGSWSRLPPLPDGSPTPSHAVRAGSAAFTWAIGNQSGRSTIRALSISVAALTGDGHATPIPAAEHALVPPAGVDRAELAVGEPWGVSTRSGSIRGTLTPFQRGDEGATVISSRAAQDRVEGDPSIPVDWVGSFLWSPTALGRWNAAGASPTDEPPLAWSIDWIVYVGPTEQGLVQAVIDARTGELLELVLPTD